MVSNSDAFSEFRGIRGLCDGEVQPGRSSLSEPASFQSQTCRGHWVKQHCYAFSPVLTNVEFHLIMWINTLMHQWSSQWLTRNVQTALNEMIYSKNKRHVKVLYIIFTPLHKTLKYIISMFVIIWYISVLMC